MTPLEQAFPLNSDWLAATVRSKLAEAMIAVFDTPDLSGEDFSIQPYPAIAVYGPDGDLTLYAFDATDTVTADDGGVSCIVVSGRRYKRSGEVIVRDAAISATTAAQPSTPSLGDTYIVPAAPSGDDWASRAKTVATYTARGWMFRQPFVGMMVYVEDEDAIYHYDSAGDWIAGLPIGAIPDGSIPPKKLVYPFAILKVEDERDAPPGSPPTTGAMYQVGTSPTGDFSGHDREIARWDGTDYEFIVPQEGDTIYRKDIETLYSFRSGVWERTAPLSPVRSFTLSTVVSSSFPDSAGPNTISTVAGALGTPGNLWRLTILDATFSHGITGPGNSRTFEMGVYVDAESTPRQVLYNLPSEPDSTVTMPPVINQIGGAASPVIYISVPDPSPHDISVKIRRTASSGSNSAGRAATANFSLEEIAP